MACEQILSAFIWGIAMTSELTGSQGLLSSPNGVFYFGVNTGQANQLLLSNGKVVDVESENKRWFVDVDGIRFQLKKPILRCINQISNEGIRRFENGEQINSKLLFQDLKTFFSKYVELDNEVELELVVLHVLHSYLLPVFGCTPYLFFVGKMGTGKTTIQKVWAATAFKGEHFVNPTPAVLFRLIDGSNCSIAVDEFDKLPEQARSEIISIYNQGYTADGTVLRCKPNTYEIERFNVFSAKTCAANDFSLIDSFVSRCINVVTVPTSRKLSNWDSRSRGERELNQKLVDDSWLFALQYFEVVQTHFGEILAKQEVTSRSNQLIAPLLAVARFIDSNLGARIEDYYVKSVESASETLRETDFDAYMVTLVQDYLKDLLQYKCSLSDLAKNLTAELQAQGLLDDKRKIGAHRVGRMLKKLGLGAEKIRENNNRYRVISSFELENCKKRFPYLFEKVTSAASATSAASKEQEETPLDITYHDYSGNKVNDGSGNSGTGGEIV